MLKHRLHTAKCVLADSYCRATGASKAWRQWQQSLHPHSGHISISSPEPSNVQQLILQFSLPKQSSSALQQFPAGAAAVKSRFGLAGASSQQRGVLPAIANAATSTPSQRATDIQSKLQQDPSVTTSLQPLSLLHLDTADPAACADVATETAPSLASAGTHSGFEGKVAQQPPALLLPADSARTHPEAAASLPEPQVDEGQFGTTRTELQAEPVQSSDAAVQVAGAAARGLPLWANGPPAGAALLETAMLAGGQAEDAMQSPMQDPNVLLTAGAGLWQASVHDGAVCKPVETCCTDLQQKVHCKPALSAAAAKIMLVVSV